MMASQQEEWDADVIKFWSAAVTSYQTCHEPTTELRDPEQIAADLVKDLPFKSQLNATVLDHEHDFVSKEETQSETPHTEPVIHTPSKDILEPSEPMFEEPNPVYEAPEEQAMDTNAYEQYYTDQSFMQPPPMPPPTTSEENELFSNVIMSWYYAGYYTALYQAQQRNH